MTEYRIVATLDTYHVYNGKRFHYDAVAPITGSGRPFTKVYANREEAETMLAHMKEQIPKHDKESQERTGTDTIMCWHSNIRIQSRKVTPWED